MDHQRWIINQKLEKTMILVNSNYLFLRHINKGNLTLKDADEEQSKLLNVLKDLNRGVKPVEKRAVINNILS